MPGSNFRAATLVDGAPIILERVEDSSDHIALSRIPVPFPIGSFPERLWDIPEQAAWMGRAIAVEEQHVCVTEPHHGTFNCWTAADFDLTRPAISLALDLSNDFIAGPSCVWHAIFRETDIVVACGGRIGTLITGVHGRPRISNASVPDLAPIIALTEVDGSLLALEAARTGKQIVRFDAGTVPMGVERLPFEDEQPEGLVAIGDHLVVPFADGIRVLDPTSGSVVGFAEVTDWR